MDEMKIEDVDLRAAVEAGEEGEAEIEAEQEVEVTWSEEEAAEAEAMGWIPPERAKKLPEGKQYVGPKEFMERNPLYRKMKEMEQSFNQLNSHYQKVSEIEHKKAEREFEQKLEELNKEKLEALNNADHARVIEIDDELRTAEKPVKEDPVDNTFQDWVSENEWYEKDNFLRVEAEKTGSVLYSDKLYGRALLDAVKDHLKQAYPDRFENPRRQAAPAVEGSTPPAKPKSKTATVKDLTADERTIYKNFERMGVFKTDAEAQKYIREVIELRDQENIMGKKWTEEQKQAASERMKAINAAKKSADAKERVRVPIGAKRDITAVQDTPDGYMDRWVNDEPGRIEKFKAAGYELVADAEVGTSHADGSHAEGGVVSRDMGKGMTAYLMRQRKDYFEEDQAEKQRYVDSTEESMRRKKINPNETTDGTYGEVRIERK